MDELQRSWLDSLIWGFGRAPQFGDELKRSWLDSLIATPEDERLVAQESLILDATEAILEQLELRRMTQRDLAQRLGCSDGHVSRLLAGSRNMTLRSLADLAWAVGCTTRVRLDPARTAQYRVVTDLGAGAPSVLATAEAAFLEGPTDPQYDDTAIAA